MARKHSKRRSMRAGAWSDYLPSFMKPAATVAPDAAQASAEAVAPVVPTPEKQSEVLGLPSEGKDALTAPVMGGRKKTHKRRKHKRRHTRKH